MTDQERISATKARNLLASKARQSALQLLADLHPVDFERLLAAERARLGLPRDRHKRPTRPAQASQSACQDRRIP